MVNRRHGKEIKIGRSVMLSPDILQALEAIAESEKRSVSFLIDEYLRAYLVEHGLLPKSVPPHQTRS